MAHLLPEKIINRLATAQPGPNADVQNYLHSNGHPTKRTKVNIITTGARAAVKMSIFTYLIKLINTGIISFNTYF